MIMINEKHIYRVRLNNTYNGLYFDFTDYGDAMGFIGMAIESGLYDGKHIEATLTVVDTEEVGL